MKGYKTIPYRMFKTCPACHGECSRPFIEEVWGVLKRGESITGVIRCKMCNTRYDVKGYRSCMIKWIKYKEHEEYE
jgi:hypothetical protein